ncbi:hypothetical protein [Streptomyces sp. NPDC002324]
MTSRMGPPVTPSAAAHAERIRARTEERAAEQTETTAGQSTAERIAAQVLPGYRADAALREQARLSELRARGVISDGAEPEDAEEEVPVDEDEDDVEENDKPVSTAERYARRERQRQQSEREANRRAHEGAVRAMAQPLPPQYPAMAAQPHRFAHLCVQPKQ